MAYPAQICVLGKFLMAQYDVYVNPSKSAAEGIPYVVVMQSNLLDALATRLTMPLAFSDTSMKSQLRCAQLSW